MWFVQHNVGDWAGLTVCFANSGSVVFFFRCFVFAGLTWYERSLASAFFATPPTATFEEVNSCKTC